MQDMTDAGQDGCRIGQIKYRMETGRLDAGQDGDRTGRMQYRTAAGQYRCRTGRMQ